MVAVNTTVRNPNTGVGSTPSTASSANSPANSPAFLNDEQTVYNDLNSGNYTGAWNTALSTSSMFGTNMSTETTDPLLADLETSKGLETFDPTKQWNASSLDAYYAAFNSTNAYHGNNTGSNGYLGKNPYGVWGNASAITSGSDQAANIAQEGDTPDVARFVGARPTQSFLSKYGGALAGLALTAVTAGAAAPLAGALLGGTTALDVGAAGALIGTAGTAAIDAGFGKPITAGSLAGGALSGVGASGALTGLGNTVGAATGLGNTGGNALLGAGVGAGGSALNHGNIELGALAGAASGAIRGSGVAGTAGSAINNATGIPTGLATGAVKAGLGYGTSAALSGLASQNGNVTSNNGTNYLGAGASGVQGNNGNMGTTDSSLAGTIGSLLPGVLQAGVGVAGNLAGSNAIAGAENNVITTNQNNLANISNIWSNQQQLGQGADTTLGSTLGTNGQPADYSNFYNMPGYQFAVQQGTQAVQRQAAAMGSAYTPNTAAAVGKYVTGIASQDYNTYVSQLMSAAGLGSTANQGLQTANQNTTNNIGTAQQNIGQAQSGAYSGVANSLGGVASSLGNVASSVLGSGGNNSGLTGFNSTTAQASDTVSGGVDPSTGVPYDIENPSYGSGVASTYNASNPLNLSGYGISNSSPNWSSVTDSPYVSGVDTSYLGQSNIGQIGSDSGDIFDFIGGDGS